MATTKTFVVKIALTAVLAAGVGSGCAAAGHERSARMAGRSEQIESFRRWLAQDSAWTQRQRLARIERDWLPRLESLSDSERAEAAWVIERQISSAKLERQRARVVESLVHDRSNDVLARGDAPQPSSSHPARSRLR